MTNPAFAFTRGYKPAMVVDSCGLVWKGRNVFDGFQRTLLSTVLHVVNYTCCRYGVHTTYVYATTVEIKTKPTRRANPKYTYNTHATWRPKIRVRPVCLGDTHSERGRFRQQLVRLTQHVHVSRIHTTRFAIVVGQHDRR